MVWRRVPLDQLAQTWRLLAPAGPSELPRGHIPALDAIRGLAIVAVTRPLVTAAGLTSLLGNAWLGQHAYCIL